MKICIIGAGYVGLPLATSFSKHYNVCCYDINRKRIESLKKGIDSNKQHTKKELQNKKLTFTSQFSNLKNFDYFIVTVPTPIKKNNLPDLKHLKKSSKDISKILRKGNIVIYESTTFPGCTEEICLPILEKGSKLKYNTDFFIAYSPERINPGDKINTLKNITKIVGANNPLISKKVKKLYEKICKNIYSVASIKIAETSKVIENIQRDINIAFVNELSVLLHKLNIPTNEVLKAASTKWNFHYYKPGLVGGHCISIDPYYLAYKAKKSNYTPKLILSGRRFNESMGKYVGHEAIKLLKKNKIQINKAKIAILGFAFKENISDFRNTKIIQIINELENYNANVKIFDPLVLNDDVKKEYNLKIFNEKDLNKFKFDMIIIAVSHKCFKKRLSFYDKFFKNKKKKILIDVKNIYKEKELKDNNYDYFVL